MPKIIVVLGPTASGKSELAVKLAKKFNGEIISADSRQVYKGLNIGSGKITKKEMHGIPHHLLDVASPKRIFTVFQYQKLATKALKKILAKGKLPIICGGTGFYIDALIYNYKFPQVPAQPTLRKKLEKKSTEELFKQLQKLDPERAKNIDRHNKRRLVRAIEIILITNKPVPLLNNIRVNPCIYPPQSIYDVLKIGIKKSPEELKKLIKKRLLKRLKMGLIDEVKNLHYQQGMSWKRLDDLGLEYRYLARYLRKLSNNSRINSNKSRIDKHSGTIRDNPKKIRENYYKEMIETLNREIYHYAKRQMTWFKRDKNIHWVKNYNEAQKLVKEFLK